MKPKLGPTRLGSIGNNSTAVPIVPPLMPKLPRTCVQERQRQQQRLLLEAARRHGEYLALVPHKLTKAWIAGIRTDKIGVDLLVKRGVTDRQLAELIRWYTGLPLLSFASLGLVALRRKLSC